MDDPLTALLDPRSVAVIGASNDPLKRGYQAIVRLREDGFPHPIYPVNPKADKVLGLTTYPSVEAIEEPVDLALIVTPAQQVPDLLRGCGRKGVGAAVVVAVGFGETGADGRALEEDIAQVAAEHGICLVGPNTNGVFNLPARLNLVGARDVPEGTIALLCQSGNMGLGLLNEAAHQTELGFSVYVGLGNEAGLRFHEVLPYLRNDPHTRAVLMYAEGFRDGRALLESARELACDKPVVAYKAGRSEAARRSALSHTGAITGTPRVAEALLRQAGVSVVERSDELLPVCETLLGQPPLARPRVAVLADGGGHATVAADALHRFGLELVDLAAATRRRLSGVLPPAASTRNPVDVAGATDRDPALFEDCVNALLDDPGVEGILCVGLFGGYGIRFSDDLTSIEEVTAHRIADLAARRGKALLVQSAYASARPSPHRVLRSKRVPVFASVEMAARCVAALWERGRFLGDGHQPSFASTPVRASLRRTGVSHVLTEPAGRRLLSRHGLPVDGWVAATDADEAARAVSELGRPVAMKAVSPEIVHKSDVGGVVLDVTTPEQARLAFEQIERGLRESGSTGAFEGVVLVPMAPPGVELIVGASMDPSFGPILTVGAGGRAVEVLEDTAFRAMPATAAECRAMLESLTIAALLAGFRGSPPVDHDAIVELLLAVCRLFEDDPTILELDLNPVVAHPGGLDLVDVRVVVADGSQVEAEGSGGRAPETRPVSLG